MAPSQDAAGVEAAAVGLSRLVAVVVVVGVLAAEAVVAPAALAGPLVLLTAVGILAGVPHGAADHLLLARSTGLRPAVAVVAYAAAAVLAWLALRWGGPAVQWLVLGLGAAHFGAGEYEVWRARSGWRPGRGVAVVLGVAGTGALLLPLARGGPELVAVARAFSPAVAEVLVHPAFDEVVVGVWVAAAAVAVTAALRAGVRGVVVDVALIAALGVLLPPLVAFAVWFGGWHAVRHTGRVLAAEVARGASRETAVRRFVRDAAAPSVAALAVVALLTAGTATAADPSAALAESLRVLLALTVPHLLVVAHLDRVASRRGAVGAPAGAAARDVATR